MNSKFHWLILPLAFFIGGCGTLNQQVKSSEPHAVLQFMPVNKSCAQHYEIRRVDDCMVHAGWFFSRNYRVSPGEHTLTFKETVICSEEIESTPSDGAIELAAIAAAVVSGAGGGSHVSKPITVTRRSSQIFTNRLTVVAGRIYVFDESGIMQSENYE